MNMSPRQINAPATGRYLALKSIIQQTTNMSTNHFVHAHVERLHSIPKQRENKVGGNLSMGL
jgi:hypothetical protein